MKTIEVVAAIIRRGDEMLATRRGYGEFIDKWEFPGGKMELGETQEKALIREIKEELSVEIGVDHFLTTVNYDYPNFHLTMHCYFCHIERGTLDFHEHNAWKWVTLETIEALDWLPADVAVVKAIQAEFIK